MHQDNVKLMHRQEMEFAGIWLFSGEKFVEGQLKWTRAMMQRTFVRFFS